MPTPKFSPKLNRFTTLPVALDVLAQKRITLLSPDSWEDRNDAYFLERYQQDVRLRSVVAICFSTIPETFHHWRIFSHGISGVCIEFDKALLLNSIQHRDGFRSGSVQYKWISQLQAAPPDVEKWPFLKRKAFEAEAEYRIIYESKRELLRFKHVEIDLSAVKNVTLSPWLPEGIEKSVVSVIRSIDGCEKLKVNRSALIENAKWRQVIDPVPTA